MLSMKGKDVLILLIWFTFRFRAFLIIILTNTWDIANEFPIEIEDVQLLSIQWTCSVFKHALFVQPMVENSFIFIVRDASTSFPWIKDLVFTTTFLAFDRLKAGTGFLIKSKSFITLLLALYSLQHNICYLRLVNSRSQLSSVCSP